MNDSLMNGITISMIVSLIALLLVACGTDTEMEDEPDPELNGDEVWNHLQEENYQDAWSLWPGTEELQEGNEPHGSLQTIYLNNSAIDAVMNGVVPLPDGAIIVKENYMAEDSTLAAITTMVKVDDYAPEHNDWFWLQNDPQGVIGAEGRVQMCQDCHAAVASDDYIFLYSQFPPEEAADNMIQPADDVGGSLADHIKSNTELMSMAGVPLSTSEINLIKEWANNGNPR